MDSYFLYLRSRPNKKSEKSEKNEKYISFEAQSISDNKEAYLNLDLTKKKFCVMTKPDNKTFHVFFNVENKNINIPISNFDKGKNELTINSSSKKLKQFILNINNLGQKNKNNNKVNNPNLVGLNNNCKKICLIIIHLMIKILK